MKPSRRRVVRVGDLVKITDERGWWKCCGKRNGWLQLSQDRGKNEFLVSVLETHVVNAKAGFAGAIGYGTVSPTQQRVLRAVKHACNMQADLGGNGRLPIISAARALKRKGILIEWRTSSFAPKDRNAPIWSEVP
jgi:hypothetical protein